MTLVGREHGGSEEYLWCEGSHLLQSRKELFEEKESGYEKCC